MRRFFFSVEPHEYESLGRYKNSMWSRDSIKWVNRLEGITDFHRFRFSGDGVIAYRSMTGIDPPVKARVRLDERGSSNN